MSRCAAWAGIWLRANGVLTKPVLIVKERILPAPSADMDWAEGSEAELGDVIDGFVYGTDMRMDGRHVADHACSILAFLHVRNTQFGKKKGRPKHEALHEIVFFHREIFHGVDVLDPGDIGKILDRPESWPHLLPPSAISSSLHRSAWRKIIWPPMSRAIFWVFLPSFSLMSNPTVINLFAEAAIAVALPIPVPQPVTMQTLSGLKLESCKIRISSFRISGSLMSKADFPLVFISSNSWARPWNLIFANSCISDFFLTASQTSPTRWKVAGSRGLLFQNSGIPRPSPE